MQPRYLIKVQEHIDIRAGYGRLLRNFVLLHLCFGDIFLTTVNFLATWYTIILI